MKTRTQILLAATSAFTGGLAAGLVCASESGRAVRYRMAEAVQPWTRRIERRLHDVQDQLLSLERQVEAAGVTIGERVHDATAHALHRYVPTMPDDPVGWHVEPGELARELPHLPYR